LPRYRKLTNLFSFFSKFYLSLELRQVNVTIFTPIAKILHFWIVSFVRVYGPKFTKFSTLVKYIRVCLSWKFDAGGGGVKAKKFKKNEKNLKFLNLHGIEGKDW